jgi:iron complex outermembrane receptor protein
MKKILLVILSMTLFTAVQAQNTLFGKVIDVKTKEGIPGTSVFIDNTLKGTMTDAEGNYLLTDIQATEVTVIFSYTGYKEQKVLIVFDKNKKELNIELQESVFELDEVILSTPFNKLQSENVVKVAHKSLASMQRNGIQNFMDGISQISGVTQLSTGSGISKPVIRGLTGSRVLVYNQGVRLENFQFGEEHSMGIDESGINSVEIIKGPASLLYGSDAMGGVLYLVPEKYAKAGENNFQIQSKYTTNTSGISTNLGYKTSGENLQFLIRTAINVNADYKTANAYRVTNSRYRDSDIKLGLGYQKNKFSTDIRYNYNKAQNGLPHSIEEQSNSYEINGLHQALDNHYVSAKTTYQFTGSKIQTNLGYTAHKRQLINDDIVKIGMLLNTFNYDIKWYLPQQKKLESIIGIQGMQQTNNNFGINYLLPDASISNLGVFSTLNYSIKKLIIQAGLRYDYRYISTQDIGVSSDVSYRPGFDKNLHNLTGSIGFKTDIFDRTTIRLNFASGYRAPNLSELTSNGIHENRIEIGNSALENEQNFQTDLAFEYQNTHIEFYANAFLNNINNYIYLSPTGETQDTYSIYQYNQNDAQLYGGEIGIHFHPHPLDWLHYESSFEMVIGKDNSDNYLPLIPANQWKNTVRFTNNFNKKYWSKSFLNIGINHTFKATKISAFENTQEAYTLLNASIGSTRQFNNFDVTANLSVHNLLDKEYISHLSVLREDEIPNMGRNIIFGITLNL